MGVQERRVHLGLGDLHRCISLLPHLQLVGRRLQLRKCKARGWSNSDRRPLQRCLPLHGLVADGALLLVEILLVMKLDDGTFSQKAWVLGAGSALMIVSGYYGELTVTGDLTPRWICWFASMCFFLYIVYELLIGLAAATQSEADPVVAGKIKTAQVMTVISWCTYPIVYLFPMLGINAATAVVSIQLGYCVSDIISKCGVGLVIYQIAHAKSSKDVLLP